MKQLVFILFIFISFSALAQNLLEEKIWKIGARKRSVYQDKGVFHTGSEGTPGVLQTVRHSMNKGLGAERIVFDFNGQQVPRIYGHLAKSQDKIYLDFFGTTMAPNLVSDSSGEYLKAVEFYPISKDILSLELSFKGKITADIFYLESPARLVIDVKK